MCIRDRDGEEQDAYILGVNEPVCKFTGKIIAIVYRKDEMCIRDSSWHSWDRYILYTHTEEKSGPESKKGGSVGNGYVEEI